MAGGTALLYAVVRGGYPLTAVDKEKNVALLKTKGGNMVAATQDPSGRVFMFDRAGNLYYDTEDPRTGLLVVDTRGEMTNLFVDKDGKVNRVPIGNIGDLRTVTVKEVGGVPVTELQKSIKGLRGGRITGFFDVAPDGDPNSVPTSALPRVPTLDGTRIGPPQILEDWEVELQPKGGGGGWFGGGSGAPEDDASLLRSLQRGDK